MSSRDLIVILPIIFTLAIGFVASQKILTGIDNANNEIDQKYIDAGQTAINVFSYGIVFITGISYLASIILAFRIRTSPIFILPSLIFLLVSILLAAEFANIFWQFANTAGITAAANQFPVMISLFKNLPIIAGIFGIGLIIVMYGKNGPDRAKVGV